MSPSAIDYIPTILTAFRQYVHQARQEVAPADVSSDMSSDESAEVSVPLKALPPKLLPSMLSLMVRRGEAGTRGEAGARGEASTRLADGGTTKSKSTEAPARLALELRRSRVGRWDVVAAASPPLVLRSVELRPPMGNCGPTMMTVDDSVGGDKLLPRYNDFAIYSVVHT